MADEVTVFQAENPGGEWTRVAGLAAGLLAPLLGSSGTEGGVSVRTFQMRPDQVREWDKLRKHGQGGYSYGMGWDNNSKIAKHFQFKEASPSASPATEMPAIDPASLAAAAAVAKMQVDLEELKDIVISIGENVQSVLDHLRWEQETDLLAAVETINSIYQRSLTEDRIQSADWDRIAHLEQLLKKTHRMVLKELEKSSELFSFRDVKGAKKVKDQAGERAQNLVALESWLLQAVEQWAALTLRFKEQRGEWTVESVKEMRSFAEDTRQQALFAVTTLHAKSKYTRVEDRPWWTKLSTNGLVVGSIKDSATVKAANSERAVARESSKRMSMIEVGNGGQLKIVENDDQ